MVSIKQIEPYLESESYRERLLGQYWYEKITYKAFVKWSATHNPDKMQLKQAEAQAVMLHHLKMRIAKLKINVACVYGKGTIDDYYGYEQPTPVEKIPEEKEAVAADQTPDGKKEAGLFPSFENWLKKHHETEEAGKDRAIL